MQQHPLLWSITSNGNAVQQSCVTVIDAHNRGVLLGDGVFDTLRVQNGQAHALPQHYQRLQNAAQTLGLSCNITITHLQHAAHVLGTGVLRPTITRGVAPRGLIPPAMPQGCALILGYQNALPPRNIPLTAYTSSIVRNDTSPLSRIKSLCQMDNVLALQQAHTKGGNEAILCNTKGAVVCASAGNLIYTLKDCDTVFTPPLSDGALNGITRALFTPTLIERTLWLHEQAQITSISMINSLRGVCPIIQWDDYALPAAASHHHLTQP